MTKNLDAIIDTALAKGLLQNLPELEQHNRPWPVAVFTGIMAWIISLPLLGLLWISLKLDSASGLIMLAIGLLGISLATLRIPGIPLFLEQFAVACLMGGGCALMFGISWHKDWHLAATVTGLVGVIISPIVPRNWLRSFIAALAVSLLIISWTAGSYYMEPGMISSWCAWHIMVAAYLTGHGVIRFLQNKPAGLRGAIALEAVIVGVGAMTVFGLAYDSGSMFFELKWSFISSLRGPPMPPPSYSHWLSMSYALSAAGWIAYRWPALRNAWLIPLAFAGAYMALFMSFMGATLLMLAVCSSEGHRKLAMLAVVAIIWMTGILYYQFNWTLINKSILLFGCAATFAMVVRFGFIEKLATIATESAEPEHEASWQRWLLGGGLVLTLAVANAAIWQKERLIRESVPIFAQLVPVDPRSILQGDYMSLAFDIPNELAYADQPRSIAIARRDEKGIIKLLRKYNGNKLATDEILIELINKNQRNVLVSDAWFFAEGTGERWSRAKYAEFRVMPDGQALLVDLRGPALEKL